jgi:hypothetical protein
METNENNIVRIPKEADEMGNLIKEQTEDIKSLDENIKKIIEKVTSKKLEDKS